MNRSNCYLLILIMSKAVHLSFLYYFPPLLRTSVLSCRPSPCPSPLPKMGNVLFTSEAYSSHSWDSLPWVLCFVLFFWRTTSQAFLTCISLQLLLATSSPTPRQTQSVFFNFIYLLAMLHCFQDLSSLTRNGPWAMAVKAWNSNHWATRELPDQSFLSLLFRLPLFITLQHSSHSICYLLSAFPAKQRPYLFIFVSAASGTVRAHSKATLREVN